MTTIACRHHNYPYLLQRITSDIDTSKFFLYYLFLLNADFLLSDYDSSTLPPYPTTSYSFFQYRSCVNLATMCHVTTAKTQCDNKMEMGGTMRGVKTRMLYRGSHNYQPF